MVQSFVLIDYENLQPAAEEVSKLDFSCTTVILFHGATLAKRAQKLKGMFPAIRLVSVDKVGKNSLDFHLMLYLGYHIRLLPKGRFLVLAKDKGYDAALRHAVSKGASVQRSSGLVRAHAPRKTRGYGQCASNPGIAGGETNRRRKALQTRSRRIAQDG